MASSHLPAQLARLGYRRVRLLALGAGWVMLVVLLATLLARSVDQVEVVATALYAPLFAAALFTGSRGGLAAGVAATIAYVVMRSDAVDAVGWGEFSALIVSRAVAYLIFGGAGGWAASTLERSLDKLDLYDHVDDRTGLGNARALLDAVDVEQARADRYRTVFSVSFVSFDAAVVDAMPARRRRELMRELGERMHHAVRTVDTVTFGADADRYRLAVVLPETGAQGAGIFHHRLIERIRSLLHERTGAKDTDIDVDGEAVCVPGAEALLTVHLSRWATIDSEEHEAPRSLA